jgi:type I restriction enzyme S subunit
MSGSLKPYPKYKESGVEWLGAVPEGWEAVRAKNVVAIELSNVDKKANDHEPAVRLCNYVDVYYHDQIDNSIEFMDATANPDQIQRLSLTVGDVIVTKDSEDPWDIGIPALVTERVRDLVCGYHLAIYRPTDALSGRYLLYALKADYAKSHMYLESRGMTRYGIGKSGIENFPIPLPPLPEQQAIADYLDAETQRIDTLIAELREMIRLLKEKRQALISRCVTKGLDPTVPMKDSGVEWLGEVPEGWDVGALKHFSRIVDCKHVTATFVEDGYPVVSIREVQSRYVDIANANRTDRLGYESLISDGRLPRMGDLIISRNATLGL